MLPLFNKANGQTIETVVQAGHYAAVTAVCYSADGKFIATGSSDKTIKLWRKTDGKEIRTFRGSTSGIVQVEINNQGTAILSVSSDGTIMEWDITSGKLIKQLKPYLNQVDERILTDSYMYWAALLNEAPADSKITVYEIKSFIDDQVPEVSYRLIRHKQFPSTFSIGHDFPLVME